MNVIRFAMVVLLLLSSCWWMMRWVSQLLALPLEYPDVRTALGRRMAWRYVGSRVSPLVTPVFMVWAAIKLMMPGRLGSWTLFAACAVGAHALAFIVMPHVCNLVEFVTRPRGRQPL